jgi:hypothetical protein
MVERLQAMEKPHERRALVDQITKWTRLTTVFKPVWEIAKMHLPAMIGGSRG